MFDISSIDFNWALEVAPPSGESPAALVTSLIAVSIGCQRTGGAAHLLTMLFHSEADYVCLTKLVYPILATMS